MRGLQTLKGPSMPSKGTEGTEIAHDPYGLTTYRRKSLVRLSSSDSTEWYWCKLLSVPVECDPQTSS